MTYSRNPRKKQWVEQLLTTESREGIEETLIENGREAL